MHAYIYIYICVNYFNNKKWLSTPIVSTIYSVSQEICNKQHKQ